MGNAPNTNMFANMLKIVLSINKVFRNINPKVNLNPNLIFYTSVSLIKFKIKKLTAKIGVISSTNIESGSIKWIKIRNHSKINSNLSKMKKKRYRKQKPF